MHIAIPVYSSHVVPIVVQLKLMILIFYNFAYIAWTSEVATVSCLYKIELKYLRYALTKDERDEGMQGNKKQKTISEENFMQSKHSSRSTHIFA